MRSVEAIRAEMSALAKPDSDDPLDADAIAHYRALDIELEAVKATSEIRRRESEWSAPRVSLVPAIPKDVDPLEFAFESYLRTGKANADISNLEVRKDHRLGFAQTETTTGGGYLVPTTTMSRLTELVKNYGGITRLAEHIATPSGNPMNWPSNDDTANTAAVVAINTAPGGAGADLVFGQVVLGAISTMASGTGNAALKVPYELTQDTTIPILPLVERKLAERIGRLRAVHHATGTGSSQPTGLFYRIPDQNLPTGNLTIGGAVTAATIYSALLDMVYGVDPDYVANGDAVWVMNLACLKALALITDTTGRPIFLSAAQSGFQDATFRYSDATDGAGIRMAGTILGYPVIVDQASPVVQNASAAPPGNAGDAFIAFGDVRRGFVIRDVQDTSILVDPYGGMSTRQMWYYAWSRYDSTIQNAKAYRLLAGYHA